MPNIIHKAQIVASHGKSYIVQCRDRTRLIASTRGKKTDFACGDWVEIQQLNQEQAVIESLLPRQTLLYRSDTFRSKLIAANVTQILIVVAPRPSFTDDLISRSLIAAEEAHIKPVIILNKTDLPEIKAARKQLQFYRHYHYPIIELSARQDISALVPLLQNETSVLVGQSGMGKSTIINTLLPHAQVRVNEFSVALDSGKHTTTHASLFYLDENSALIDSPGLQSFGLYHLAPEALIHFMPDLQPYIGQCRFHNCQHRSEPGCAIQTAIAKGEVQASRLAFYQRLQDELTKQSY
jgi:ribosome biogenesis GTPase